MGLNFCCLLIITLLTTQVKTRDDDDTGFGFWRRYLDGLLEKDKWAYYTELDKLAESRPQIYEKYVAKPTTATPWNLLRMDKNGESPHHHHGQNVVRGKSMVMFPLHPNTPGPFPFDGDHPEDENGGSVMMKEKPVVHHHWQWRDRNFMSRPQQPRRQPSQQPVERSMNTNNNNNNPNQFLTLKQILAALRQ